MGGGGAVMNRGNMTDQIILSYYLRPNSKIPIKPQLALGWADPCVSLYGISPVMPTEHICHMTAWLTFITHPYFSDYAQTVLALI